LVVFVLHAVLFFLLILIVGYLWAVVIGVFSLWEWLAKRSRR